MVDDVHPRGALGQESEGLGAIPQPSLDFAEGDLAELDLRPGKVDLGELRDVIGGTGADVPPLDLS